jgi:hypothetical protein
MAFATAFGLETLVFSHQVWARLSVGITLAMMILLILWCIWTTIEAGSNFSVLGIAHQLKNRLVRFTRRLRGKTPYPGPVPGDCEDEDGRRKSEKPHRLGSLKEAFNLFRRRRGISTSSTLVSHPVAGNRLSRPSDSTGVEMGEINDKELGCAV